MCFFTGVSACDVFPRTSYRHRLVGAAAFAAYRRVKEFCGEFGLLLPDATRLPIAFDILLSNLQVSLAALLLDEL